MVFAADGVIAFLFAWELMTLVTAALVATEHEDRANRRAAFLYLVMSHVGTGCLIAGFLIAGRDVGLAGRSTRCSRATSVSGPLRDAAVRALLARLRRQGRRDSAARVAARGASGGADATSPR